MDDDLTVLVDKKMMLEEEIKREADIFKTKINELIKTFEKDTGVYLKDVVPGYCMGSVEVEIDFEKTKVRNEYKKEVR
jgi:hypothetical protein